MSLRTRLLAISASVVLITVAVVAWVISANARRAFERLDAQRTLALVGQFHREFDLRGEEVELRAEAISRSEPVRRMALELSRPGGDAAIYVNIAGELAAVQQLQIVEVVGGDGTIISSAHWPARFGFRESWIAGADWQKQPPFLAPIDFPEGSELALLTVRPLHIGDSNLFLVVGHRVDAKFLATLVAPEGSRLLLWRVGAPSAVDANGTPVSTDAMKPLLAKVQSSRAESTQRVDTSAGSETVHGIPLLSRSGEPLAVLLVASTRSELIQLQRHIRWIALLSGGLALLASVLLSLWWAARISRPIEDLALAAQDVARGNWDRKVETSDEPSQRDEVAQLALAFNRMTGELVSQRERALQAERVAAWRELARRLAHELKNPLFPLQITVENLMRARQQNSPEFEEIFQESTTTLLAELANLKKIIGRFSDFSKMPAPQLQPLELNVLLRDVAKLYSAQLAAPGKPAITLKCDFTSQRTTILGDPDLLRRAFENLVLNAIDAMPNGGTLQISTSGNDSGVTVEFHDTGSGLTEEEVSRLFTPYYTTKQFGTGLGLAIVQSVISDHKAEITVASEKQRGTTFRIHFPVTVDGEAALPHPQTTQSISS